jgi:integrase
MHKEDYPFGKHLYQIPKSRNEKKALTSEELIKIIDYSPDKGTKWEEAKDYWLFSFYANGINMKDITLLKLENIDNDHIRFERAKTRNTNRTVKKISFFLTPEVREIIKRRAIIESNEYLFPILDGTENALQQENKIGLFTRMVNTYIGKIAEEQGIKKHVTTYHARHSFATILKRNGHSIEEISDSLGHSNIRTTESYLDSFDDDTSRNIANTLTESLKKGRKLGTQSVQPT